MGIQAIVAHCPDVFWTLVVGPGEVRSAAHPIEVVSPTFADVDWVEGRLTVRSPKTARHQRL